MELRQLEALYWIAKLGSFSAAAVHLRATQPAISGRIASLEGELGVQLFERTGNKVRLSYQGQEIAEIARQMIEASAAIRSAAAGDSPLQGTIRLGIGSIVAYTWLADLVRRIQTDHPLVDLDVQVAITPDLHHGILAHDYDLIVSREQVAREGFESQFLYRENFDWVASSALDLPPEPVPLADIARHRIITFPRRTYSYNAVVQLFRDQGIWPIDTYRSNSPQAILELAREGLGIAAFPGVIARRLIAAGELRTIRATASVPPLEFFLTHPVGGALDRRTRMAIETVRTVSAAFKVSAHQAAL